MAVVKLGNKVKTNLPDMIRYVINPEKNDGGRLARIRELQQRAA